jgi:hypothetical protein
VPREIVAAGHELGFHCHIHRSLIDTQELAADIAASAHWRAQYNVRGYRAPRIGISEAGYEVLSQAGFEYSSSIYAPAGVLLKKQGVWELPVSTLTIRGTQSAYTAPRDFSLKLLTHGEFPYGSSFSIGLSPGLALKALEKDLGRGLCPVIFLHPYELVRPPRWFERAWRDVARYPLLYPFTRNKSAFLATLLKNFPVSPLGDYLNDIMKDAAYRNVS